MLGNFSLKLDPEHNIEYLNHVNEKHWEIVFVDTGEATLKGGRIKRVQKYINGDIFHLTYGDGVCDIDINRFNANYNSDLGYTKGFTFKPGTVDKISHIISNYL